MDSNNNTSIKPWTIFFFVTIGTLMVNIDSSTINVALPTLQKYFDAPITQVQWTITIYFLIITGILPLIGKLSDEFGRKKFFISGVVIFILGSICSGFSPTLFVLIIARAIEGIGAAMIMGNVMGIVANIFQAGNRGKALGTIGAVVATGTIAGPALGGLIIDLFGWRYIFFINVPLSILSILGTAHYLPSFAPKHKKKMQFDIAGSILFFLATTTLLYFISNTETLTDQIWGIVLIISSVIAWMLFFFTEAKAKNPMIDLTFFKNSQFTIGITSLFIFYFLMMSTFVLLPIYFDYYMHIPVFYIGLLMTPQAIAMFILSPISGWLSDKIGTLIPSILGMVVITLSLLWMISFDIQTTYTKIVITMAALGVGFSLFGSPNNAAILESLPASHSGIVGSLIATVRNFGQVTGTTVGIVMLNFGLNQYDGNYDQTINMTFTTSAAIGILAVCILMLRIKRKKEIESSESF